IFFFQAEDGIRYFHVTGVQTCALPIYRDLALFDDSLLVEDEANQPGRSHLLKGVGAHAGRSRRGRELSESARCALKRSSLLSARSEERRVGQLGGAEG